MSCLIELSMKKVYDLGACFIFRAWNNVSGMDSASTEVVFYRAPVIDQEATGVITNTSDKVITVLPAKSDSYVMFCLQSYQGLIFDRSLVC